MNVKMQITFRTRKLHNVKFYCQTVLGRRTLVYNHTCYITFIIKKKEINRK
jgi:hypothetical protein